MDNQPASHPPDMPQLVIGSVVDVTIVKNANYGIWCKKDDFDILVLIPEMSWNIYETRAYAKDFSLYFPVGRSISVKITRYVPEKNQYVASIKETQPELDPRNHPGYFVGAVWRGKVTSIQNVCHDGTSYRNHIINLLPGRLFGKMPVFSRESNIDVGKNVLVRVIELSMSWQLSLELVPDGEISETIFEADSDEWKKKEYWLKLASNDCP